VQGWILNPASTLVQRLGCAGAAGSTHYAAAMEEAKYELGRNGRGNVQDIIIFLSDGAANTMPPNFPAGDLMNSYTTRPCGAGVAMANSMKGPQSNPSTIIYTIGYDLDAGTGAPEKCLQPDANGHQDTSSPALETGCGLPPTGWGSAQGCTSYDAIRAMATDPDGTGPAPPLFYNKPTPGDLTQIFQQIALDISASRGRLIDNATPNLLGP
jgi:hypothetical protein